MSRQRHLLRSYYTISTAQEKSIQCTSVEQADHFNFAPLSRASEGAPNVRNRGAKRSEKLRRSF